MRNPMSPRFWKHVFALWWLCVLACGGEPTRPTGPLVLTAVSGPQQARVGQMLPAPLQIRVRTSALDPVPHVVVQWRADAGALAGTVSSTDANGVASMQWRLDTIAGEAHAFASVDSAVPVSFTGLALPGTPLALTITPANVSAEPRSTVQLSATGADRYGNAVLASQVIWSSDISIVASVSPSGLITGGRAGTAHARAMVDNIAAERLVTVPAHWRAIAAGQGHTCALDDLGYVFCWGTNDEAQLGVAGIDSSSVPVPVTTTLQFSVLAAGRDHTCGLTAGHQAYCWGRNGEGQLGSGSFQPAASQVPILVTGGHQLISIAVNDGVHTCALTATHTALCWGWEGEGELGNGRSLTFTGQPSPQTVLGNLTFDTLATGGSHTCGVTTSSAAYCWGNDALGQVGDSNPQTPPYRPAPVAVVGGLQWSFVAGGGSHTCALTPDGTAYCWGGNDVGQIGDGSIGGVVLSPTPVQTGLRFTDVASAESTNCAVTTAGESYCWGDNTAGQVGDSTTSNRSVPTRTQTAVLFAKATVGWRHACAITASGDGYCWGANDQGQLGTGTAMTHLVPSLIVAPR